MPSPNLGPPYDWAAATPNDTQTSEAGLVVSNGRQSPLGRLAETLSSERDALIRSVAALQLVPTNATKWMRFERIIEACSSTEAAVDERTVSNGRLRQLLSTAPIATPD